MVWDAIKAALNGTLGTSEFKPLDEIMRERFGAIDAVLNDLGSSEEPHGFAEFTTAGTHTWICPEGVYSVQATIISASGGGGGGGGGAAGRYNYTCGGGGGSGGSGGTGCRFEVTCPVTPGDSYTVIVGAGGSGGTAGKGTSYGTLTDGGTGGTGGTGGKSSFCGIEVIGGAGGTGGKGGNIGKGGSNGATGATGSAGYVLLIW